MAMKELFQKQNKRLIKNELRGYINKFFVISSSIPVRTLQQDEYILENSNRYCASGITIKPCVYKSSIDSDQLLTPRHYLYVILAMTRSGFRFYPITLDGIRYNFLIYKGFGGNPNMWRLLLKEFGIFVKPNKRVPGSPFSIMEFASKAENRDIRIFGGAYYCYLLKEKVGYQRGKIMGLRLPKIISLIKFSRKFSIQYGLPIPDSDDPADSGGESMQSYISNSDDVSIPNSHRSNKESSIICGQNIRLIRNVLRISDLHLLKLRLSKCNQREKKISILDNMETLVRLSILILNQELGCKNPEEFLGKMAGILGKQTARLINGRLIHNLLTEHTQNVTLAGELTEFDYSGLISDPWIINQAASISNYSTYIQEFTSISDNIKSILHSILYRQISLLAIHIFILNSCLAEIDHDIENKKLIENFVISLQNELCLYDIKKIKNHFKYDRYCFDSDKLYNNAFLYYNVAETRSFMKELVKRILAL